MDDWTCKSCKGPDGKSYRNFGFRKECNLCKLQKGSCCAGKVPAASPVQRTLAARQIHAQKKDEQQQQQQKKARQKEQQLLQELKLAKQKISDLEQAQKRPSDDEVEEAPRAEQTSLAELERKKKVYAELDDSARVAEYEERIKARKSSEFAATPVHEQLRRAEKECTRCSRALDKAKGMHEDLQKQLLESAQAVEVANAAWQKAEQQRESIKADIAKGIIAHADSPLLAKSRADVASVLPMLLLQETKDQLGISDEFWARFRAAHAAGILEEVQADQQKASKAAAEAMQAEALQAEDTKRQAPAEVPPRLLQAQERPAAAAADQQSQNAVASAPFAHADSRPFPQHLFEEDDIFMQMLADDDEELANAARLCEEAAKRRRILP